MNKLANKSKKKKAKKSYVYVVKKDFLEGGSAVLHICGTPERANDLAEKQKADCSRLDDIRVVKMKVE